jgi:hypothetical protein
MPNIKYVKTYVMRKQLIFEIFRPVKVDLSQPAGIPDQCFEITIGGFAYGRLIKRGGKWIAHLNPKGEKELTAEDIKGLCDKLDEAFPDL